MKVGDYVRTKYGIAKIKEYEEKENDDNCYYLDNNILDDDEYLGNCLYDYNYYLKQVIKSSSNIIDLIQVGDIVNYEQLNGGVVLNKKDDSIDTWSILPNSLKNEDIKSVITKEQLKNCMYEVGE